MRCFHIGDRFEELDEWPQQLPEDGFLWITSSRREFEVNVATVQSALQRWGTGVLLDLHVSDLINNQLPSHYDYTSWYDVLVFRRLAAGPGTEGMFVDEERGTLATARKALASIDTSPIGFAAFDRVLLTVHPAECRVRDFFVERLSQLNASAPDAKSDSKLSGPRLPPSPPDLMVRIVNHLVDSYLELRRLLTRQLGYLQHELLSARAGFDNWQWVLESRNALHLLEDVCEDQRAAIQEWIDALIEWPAPPEPAAAREREVLRVRSSDVLEHIERVLSHVRRLESSAESAVQMHFSAQSNRTNEIMRTLTVLTAIFLPLNLITGIFGMNFEALPLIHQQDGFWIAFGVMGIVGIGLGVFFWRKRYLGRRH
jgi:Mg2+ and Co2+ transporter CorA